MVKLVTFLAFVAGGLTVLFSHTTQPYYHTEQITEGKVRVVCENGGDATIRPTYQFGSIIVDCGTK